MSEKTFFANHVMAPSIFGPFRQPRFGGSDRTGLGFDQTAASLVFSTSAAHVQFLQADSQYGNAAYKTDVATTGTGLGALSTVAAGSQFPAAAQIADCNLVAVEIYAYYIGSPLNVAGECIMGCTIPVVTTTTRDSLFFYPGTVKFPVAELISGVKRSFGRKLSAVADEFQPTTTISADYDLPFIAVTGMPSDGQVRVVITRSWEYRSTTVPGSVVPYELVGPEFSSDTSAYQNARAALATMPSTVTSVADSAADGFLNALGYGSGIGGIGALGALGTYHLGRAAAGRTRRSFSINDPNMSSMGAGLANMVRSSAYEY